MKKLNSIMLIDDNHEDNFIHQIIIEDANAAEKIIIAEDALEALDILEKLNNCPDLIFLDINMPKMNGWEFLEAYSKTACAGISRPVIIMLTTSINPSDEARAQTVDAISGFEIKPLTEEMLERITSFYFTEKEV